MAKKNTSSLLIYELNSVLIRKQLVANILGQLIIQVPKLWHCGEPFKRKQEAEEEIHKPYHIWWSKVLLGRDSWLKRAGSRWDSPATGVTAKVTGKVKCGPWRRAEVRAKALVLQRSQPAKRPRAGLQQEPRQTREFWGRWDSVIRKVSGTGIVGHREELEFILPSSGKPLDSREEGSRGLSWQLCGAQLVREGRQCGGRESRQVTPKIVLAGEDGIGTGRWWGGVGGSRRGGSDLIRL